MSFKTLKFLVILFKKVLYLFIYFLNKQILNTSLFTLKMRKIIYSAKNEKNKLGLKTTIVNLFILIKQAWYYLKIPHFYT